MSYNSRILRIFTEMPKWDDTELALATKGPHEQGIEDKRLFNIARLNKLISKINLHNDISIETYVNSSHDNYIVYLVKTTNGQRQVIGELNAVNTGYPYPAVQMSYVNKLFQGKGYSKLMYKTLIGYLGGLVSDEKLTGEHVHGSFNIWASLGKELYTYVIQPDDSITEVGNFDKSMMDSENKRFMVTEDEYEQDNF
jgi:hypothetical protein